MCCLPLAIKPHQLDEQTFITQVNQCHGLILKLIGLYAYSVEDRNDMYQEILLNAWKGLPAFRGEAKFSTWIYQIALNTIFTLNRKRARMSYQDTMKHFIIPVNLNHDEKEDVRRLYVAIRQLPEADRAIITLHLEGYSNQEVAELIGIKPNHVGVKLHRLKNQLQTLLKQE